jgi:GNAT superfamily N-acetyltransferase
LEASLDINGLRQKNLEIRVFAICDRRLLIVSPSGLCGNSNHTPKRREYPEIASLKQNDALEAVNRLLVRNAVAHHIESAREDGAGPRRPDRSLESSPMQIAAQTVLRRLWTADKAAFRDHLLRLDAQSRHDRFGGGVSDEFLVNYAAKCFGAGDLVFGAFADGELRGAGELRSGEAIWTESAPFARRAHAEAAFSVEGAYRRQGIGERLFARLLRAASNHGVETIEILCQADNRPMQRLAAKFSTEFHFKAHEVTGRLIAQRPTPQSLWREASQDVADLTSAGVDAQLRALFPDRTPEA